MANKTVSSQLEMLKNALANAPTGGAATNGGQTGINQAALKSAVGNAQSAVASALKKQNTGAQKTASVPGTGKTVSAPAQTQQTDTPQTQASATGTTKTWQNLYTPTQTVVNAQQYLQQQQQKLQGMQYGGSPYDRDIQAAYQAITARGPFSFDVNADALYQQYRDLYAENGRQASLNAQGQAAALTGGYGNSYAASAGNAAYDQYMTQLNDRALDIYDRAYQRWQDEGSELQQRYGLAADMADRDYGRWNDEYSRGLAERDYAYKAYGDTADREYEQWQNSWQQSYELAMSMIQNGMKPSAQLLANAGLSDEDIATLEAYYAPKKTGGGGGKTTQDDGNEDVFNVLAEAVDAGNLSIEAANRYWEQHKNDKDATKAKSYVSLLKYNGGVTR